MRLINARTLQFEEFFHTRVGTEARSSVFYPDYPEYYILSHRWGDDEINYKDFKKGRRKDSTGYRKIQQFCKFVLTRLPASDQDAFVWVDTCCIDKSSSAELSMSINSMYQYYAHAVECIVLLSDVKVPQTSPHHTYLPRISELIAQIGHSQWFKRGWTLQELLAPDTNIFVDSEWVIIGYIPLVSVHRNASDQLADLTEVVAIITTIPHDYLTKTLSLRTVSVARRMSWAANRRTTRVEDEAYCLMGLFNINMPLLYGEGRRAFMRLQHEIMKTSTDHSIFAHDDPHALAQSTKAFEASHSIACLDSVRALSHPFEVTNAGIRMQGLLLSAGKARPNDDYSSYLLKLNCVREVEDSGLFDPDSMYILLGSMLEDLDADPGYPSIVWRKGIVSEGDQVCSAYNDIGDAVPKTFYLVERRQSEPVWY